MNHNNFILSPISEILKDVASASIGLGTGIETYPLCDYVMQSVFLKMTGAQEQKMKCICWELATNDYEYRYFRFTQRRLGECSDYSEKREIYKDLLKQINKEDSVFTTLTQNERNDILSNTNLSIERIFANSNLLIWAQKSFHEYQDIWTGVSKTDFANDKDNLFTGTNGYSLKQVYENHLYKHRNRVAHNTLSYQQNLPTLKTLIHRNYKYDNYFIFFALLILIDSIFIELYKKYLVTIEDI
jgi:hypothetical protein